MCGPSPALRTRGRRAAAVGPRSGRRRNGCIRCGRDSAAGRLPPSAFAWAYRIMKRRWAIYARKPHRAARRARTDSHWPHGTMRSSQAPSRTGVHLNDSRRGPAAQSVAVCHGRAALESKVYHRLGAPTRAPSQSGPRCRPFLFVLAICGGSSCSAAGVAAYLGPRLAPLGGV